jgi:hypothetical protein
MFCMTILNKYYFVTEKKFGECVVLLRFNDSDCV